MRKLPVLVAAVVSCGAVFSTAGFAPQEPAPPTQQLVRHDPVIGCIVAGHFPVLDSCVDPASNPTIARCTANFRGQGAPTWFKVESKPHPTRPYCYQSILLKPKKKTLTAMEFYFECLSKNAADNRTEDFTAKVVDNKSECDKDKLLAAPFSNTGPVGVLGSGPGFAGAAGSILPIAGAVGGLGAIGGAIVATNNNDSGGDGTSTVTTTTITTTTTTTTTSTTTTTTTTTTVPTTPNRPPEITCNVRGSTEGPPPLTLVLRLCGSRDPDGDDLRFEYDFGDGTIGGGSCESDSHTYSGEGSWTATACVSDRQPGADHKKCCTFPVRAAFTPPPPPSCDTSPPSVAITSPAGGPVSDPVKVSASASDNGTVVSVSFFYEVISARLSGARAVALPPVLIGTDTSAPFEVNWDVPNTCDSFNLTAEATDNCGNKTTSSPPVTVFNAFSCGELTSSSKRTPDDSSGGPTWRWSSRLEAAGSVGRLSLNGALLANGPGKQQGVAQAKRDENRVDGELVQGASRPGLWRFELGDGVAPGSVRVLAGDALEVNDNAVVFRVGGTTGERVSFAFRPRD